MAAAGSIAGGSLEFIFTGDSTGLKTAAKSGEKNLRRLERAQTSSDKQFKRGKITGQDYIRTQNKITESVKQETRALGQLGIKVQGVNKVFKQGSGRGRSRHGAHAAQEFTRGIADFNAAGGFTDFSRGAQGAANNVERMTEILGYAVLETGSWKGALKGLAAGFLGPVGIITAITLLVQFGPKIFAFFADALNPMKKLKEEMKALQKEINEFRDKPLTPEQKHLDNWDKLIEKQEKVIKLVEKSNRISTAPGPGVNLKALTKRGDVALEYAKLQQTINKEAKKADKKKFDDAVEYERRLKELKSEEDISVFEAATPGVGKEVDSLEAAFPNFNRNDVAVVDANDVAIIDEYTDSIEDLNAILRDTNSIFADMSVGQAEAWMQAQEQFEKTKFTIKDVSGALVGAFDAAASKGGNVVANLATGILSAIGSLLIKEGGAYIALGIARNAALPGSGTPVIAGGIGLIVAGAGLKAAGAAIGSGGAGAGAGGGGSASAQAPVAAKDPSFTQGGSTGNGIVGKIRGNDWVLMNQVANDRRNGQTGSFSLG